ncbi:MAG: serine hydrolase [Bacteroidia bacterium]
MRAKKPTPKPVVSPVKKEPAPKNFLLKKIPFFYTPLLLLILFFGAFAYKYMRANGKTKVVVKNEVTPAENCYKLFREYDFPYTQPLVLFEKEKESSELDHVKQDVSLLIDQLVLRKIISSASVYVSNLQNDKWFWINPDERFRPASLLKIPVLMIYLKASEKDPSVLDRKIKFNKPPDYIPDQTFKTKTLIAGNSYTIKELFSYMIIYSDNNATHLLNKSLDVEAFQNLFTSIGMKKPVVDDRNFDMSVFDYSKFFHILYNSTYLSHTNSNYALSLLAQCEFKDGMVKGLPEGIPIAHKFGESGEVGGIREFHESGVIYTDKGALLITIFTKGENVKTLPAAISNITEKIYNSMLNPLQATAGS